MREPWERRHPCLPGCGRGAWRQPAGKDACAPRSHPIVIRYNSSMNKRVVIIGGGPAGLTAGYLLAKRGVAVTVLEADPKYVGGLSRTVSYQGFLFDIGGHRF